MKIFFKSLQCLVLFSLAFAVFTDAAHAGINLPFSSSFACSAWKENYPSAYNPGCNGLSAVLFGNTSWHSEIASAANNPAGSGGNGWRMWLGDGHNINSSSYGYTFNTPQREIWCRFYLRYQNGFSWSGSAPYYHKIIYLYTAAGANGGFEWGHTGGSGRVNAWSNYTSSNPDLYWPHSSGDVWRELYPSGRADGTWHCYEFHAKMDTNGSNGVAELWIDGVKRFSSFSMNWSGGDSSVRQGWQTMGLSVNQDTPANSGGIGSPAYVDFDDFVINNTGYIGPLGSGSGTGRDTTPPARPSGVRGQVIGDTNA